MKRGILTGLFLMALTTSALQADLALVSLEDGKFQNKLGDLTGSWGTLGGKVKMGVHGEDDKSKSLRFEYNVSVEHQNAGYWFSFRHLDMRPYQSVRFKVRGRNGGE